MLSDFGLYLVFLTQLSELLLQIVMLRMILSDKRKSVESLRELVIMIEKRLR
jgi:hypothetical protein